MPRGSKNGSGAIIRMCMQRRPSERAGGVAKRYMLHYAAPVWPAPVTADVRFFDPDAARFARNALIWILKIVVSGGLLYVLLVARGLSPGCGRWRAPRRFRGRSRRSRCTSS